MDDPFSGDGTGLRLAVRLTPRARRTEAVGIVRDAEGRVALAVRIAAPPVDGAANEALIAWLAKVAGVAKSAVSILSGHGARTKMLRLTGDPEMLAERIRALL